MLNRITRSSFGRNVLKLAGASSIAQVIAICALPIISRLYAPGDFEVFAVFISLLAILGIASSLSFDIAVPIADDDESAVHLFVLGIASVLVFVLAQLLLIALVGFESIARLLPDITLATLLLVPIATLGVGTFNCVSQWSVRRKRFGAISATRICQSAIAVLFQIGVGLFWPTPIGLCVGRALNFSAGILLLTRQIRGLDRSYFSTISIASLKSTARRFRDYPIFVSIENVFNISGTYLPILIISGYAAGSEGAFLLLAIQVSFLPVNLIGRAVGQVFTSEIPEARKTGALSHLVYKTIWRLSKLGALPAIAVAIFSPLVTGFILGADWVRVGTLIALAMPWCFFVFISSPVSTLVYALERQRHFTIILGSANTVKILTLFLLGTYEVPYLTEAFLFLNTLQFASYLMVYVHFAKVHGRTTTKAQ